MDIQANEAIQAIHECDWKRAEQIAREHLQDAPDDPDWLTPLAVALQMQRRWEEGWRVFKLIEGAVAGDIPGQRRLAEDLRSAAYLLRDQGDWDKAGEHHRVQLAIAERLSQENPDDGESQCLLAVGKSDCGDLRLAQQDFQGA